MFEETGCGGLLLARGTFGQAWLIEDLIRHFEGLEPKVRCGFDLRDAFLSHFEHVASYQSPRRTLVDLRRIGAWYLRQGQGLKGLKDQLRNATSVSEVIQQIKAYPWEEVTL